MLVELLSVRYNIALFEGERIDREVFELRKLLTLVRGISRVTGQSIYVMNNFWFLLRMRTERKASGSN
jgi:hypothetical protein